ncbi:MAG: exodeoxyribonuclease III, partial [Thermoanaerobaculia bacterium]|nr:exodeoxyribonuclease III [Thermoanaerobaculia bacterium]
MRIATWNVNGLRARLDFVLHWLKAREPDLVGLQELKLEEEQFPHDVFEEAGYRAAVHGQKSWNGVAVLSRHDIGAVERGLGGQEGLGARLIEVETGGLRFATIYCPNGKSVDHDDYPLKLAWFDALARRLREKGGGPRVVGGDFNICPTELDTWDEEGKRGSIFHTDEERERFQRLLDAGYHDLFRELHPEAKTFSWWDYRGGAFHRGMGLRLDILLGTPEVLDRVRSVEVDREYRKKKEGLTASDHAPVIADLEG